MSAPSGGRLSSSASSTPRHQLGQLAWSCSASQTGSRGDSSSQVVRKAYSAIGAPPLVVVRRLPVADVRLRRLGDLREADHGDQVLFEDRPAVDLLEELALVLEAAELRIVVLDVAAREVFELL